MDDIEIVWNYEEDAASDAKEENTNSEDLATIVNSTLPEDVTYEEAIAAEDVTITVYEDGVEVDDVEAEFIGTNDAPALSLQNFEWNKAYTIKAVYSLAAIDVTITINVNTVDRVRDAITIDLADEQWSLTKEFETESETAAESIEAVYAKLVENGLNAKMGAADFLKDIFVTKAYTTDANTANGADAAVTKLAIDATEGATIKSFYNITDFTAAPEAVEYVMTVTTWYGQEITFTKTLNIGLTPVEITLNEETEYLVKDLEINTDTDSDDANDIAIDPETLAPIYENVTNVDKTSYTTAADYLKAIFTNNTNFSAAEILANGETLANTQIVVAADGATATATYTYEDFTVTPEQVVYKSTFTTWYGQVVVINKVIDIDYTTYDYVHVSEFVYGDTGNYYSKAIAKYDNDPEASSCLSGISIYLDLDTAFKLFDKDGNPVNFNGFDLYEPNDLGLTSVFDFTEQPKSPGIKFEENMGERNNNRLIYNGSDATVSVKPELVLTNSNGVKTVMKTSFDAGKPYAGYYIKKFNPVRQITYSDLVIPVADIAKVYTYSIMNQFSVKDVRMFELIAPAVLDKDTDKEYIYKPGAWVTGNGVDNGFADGVTANSIYGLEFIDFEEYQIPSSIKGLLTVEDNGDLVFNNMNQLKLTSDVTFSVDVLYKHTWIESELHTIKVTLKAPKED
jgi:hypothetical protein